jgi:hypothetical protein
MELIKIQYDRISKLFESGQALPNHELPGALAATVSRKSGEITPVLYLCRIGGKTFGGLDDHREPQYITLLKQAGKAPVKFGRANFIKYLNDRTNLSDPAVNCVRIHAETWLGFDRQIDILKELASLACGENQLNNPYTAPIYKLMLAKLENQDVANVPTPNNATPKQTKPFDPFEL